MDPGLDGYISEDEILFGKMTLKEVKKRLFMDDKLRQNLFVYSKTEDSNPEESIRIIDTHSEPGTVLIDDDKIFDLKSISSPDFSSSKTLIRKTNAVSADDSFIKLERMVSDLCISQESVDKGLDNTLDVVNFILKNADLQKEDLNIQSSSGSVTNVHANEIENIKDEGFLKCDRKLTRPLTNTPCNKPLTTKTNQNNNIFKTPMLSSQKSITKTPKRINAYQHITSPIASYIKKSPQVPLLKDVHPSKPLPENSSHIPKLVKPIVEIKTVNKENIQLPSIAYKSAKTTKTVTTPARHKMPQGEWLSKLTKSLEKPVVLKHEHRIIKSAKNSSKRQEDSFGDLTLRQADLSVYSKISTFVKEP